MELIYIYIYIYVYIKKNIFKHKILRYSAFQWSLEKLQERYKKGNRIYSMPYIQYIFYAIYVTKIIKYNELTFHKELDKDKISKELLAQFTSCVPLNQSPY